MTHTQRDLYQNQAKQEPGKVPLNLIGGKFYQAGEKKQQSIWEKDRRGKEKKSRWSNIKARPHYYFCLPVRVLLLDKSPAETMI